VRNSWQVTFFRVGAAPAVFERAASASVVVNPTAATSPTIERVRMAFFIVWNR
jgi:hypothetical protein